MLNLSKKSWALFLAVAVVIGGVVVLLPKQEYTFEFDGVNLRFRESERYRSALFGFVIWERCSAAEEHPTAIRLRELGVLAPVREQDSQWLLISGFTSSVRGWRGSGRDYVQALGATSFGTPVTLPAEEDISKNPWVDWALKDRAAAKHFWLEMQAVALETRRGGYYLRAAKEFLEEHKMALNGKEMEAHAKRMIEP